MPPRAQLDDLYDYGAARGVSFVPLGQPGAGGAGLPAYDAERVDRLEAELEQARTALAALEEEAAAERLNRVEAELLAHPHLPQAAFLMAECLTLQAQAAGPGTAHASELRQRSVALEGPRAVAFGEAVAAAASAPAASIGLAGLAAMDEVEVDGQALGRGRQVALAPGLHHVRVLRAGRLIYAAFETLAPEQAQLELTAPAVRACSYDDLGGVDRALVAQGAKLLAPVACRSWALVRAEPGGVGVASCSHSGCGPFVHWQRRRAPEPFVPLGVERGRLPGWAGFAIAGAGAALATSFVLWQSGALDGGQGAAGLKYGGIKPGR